VRVETGDSNGWTRAINLARSSANWLSESPFSATIGARSAIVNNIGASTDLCGAPQMTSQIGEHLPPQRTLSANGEVR